MDEASAIYDEPADEIVRKALAVGVLISREQLADWHRAGLIPTPKVDYPGGGGSSSVYPRGTFQQTIACARLMAKYHSVEKVGWILWINCFPVRGDVWQKQFTAAQQLFRLFRSEGIENDEFSDATENALARMTESKRLGNWLGLARRRLGKQTGNVIALILTVFLGRFLPAENQEIEADEKLFSRLLGLTAGTKKKKVLAAPLLPDSGTDFRSRLDQMGSVLQRLSDRDYLSRCSAADLANARDEFAFLFGVYMAVRNAERLVTGRFGGDVALLRKIVSTLSSTLQAALILIWSMCREIPSWKEGYNSLTIKFREEMIRRRKLQDSHPE